MLVSFVLYCINGLVPLLVIVIDAVVLLVWIVAVALVMREDGDFFVSTNCSIYLDSSYDYYYYYYHYDYSDYSHLYAWCQLSKTWYGFMIVEMCGP
jgi:hypothetical protein